MKNGDGDDDATEEAMAKTESYHDEEEEEEEAANESGADAVAEPVAVNGLNFCDNSRDSLALLRYEAERVTTMRQSPELESDDAFYAQEQSVSDEALQRLMALYPAYWERLLNDPELSMTKPEVYRVARVTDDAVMRRLQAILLDSSPRFVLKATLLTERNFTEIAHEIRCGFYLGELNYGYRHCLTPHFTQLCDWWMTQRKNLPQDALRQSQTPDRYWQFVVAERVDASLSSGSITGGKGLEGLRHRLFQIFLSLEVAWLANQYVHYDLHAGNVHCQTVRPSSPLWSKNLCYKRANNDTQWYSLDARILDNQIMKLLDYGRNRMVVPGDVDAPMHTHQRVLSVKGFERAGITERPNRCYDLRRLLLEILRRLSYAELEEIVGHADYLDFCAMVDSVFAFHRTRELIGEAVSLAGEKTQQAQQLVGHIKVFKTLSTRAILAKRRKRELELSCELFFDLYRRVLVYSATDTGATATSCLDTKFFDPLKRDEIADSARNVIVSFPTADLLETRLPTLQLQASPHGGAVRRCHLCAKVACKISNYKGERLTWCGAVCYQFHYHHRGLTTVG